MILKPIATIIVPLSTERIIVGSIFSMGISRTVFFDTRIKINQLKRMVMVKSCFPIFSGNNSLPIKRRQSKNSKEAIYTIPLIKKEMSKRNEKSDSTIPTMGNINAKEYIIMRNTLENIRKKK